MVERRRTWVAFGAVIVAWGSSYLFMRLALRTWNPFGLVATRFSIAAALCAGLAVLRRERFPRGRQFVALVVVGVMMMSGANALTAWAQRTVSSGLAGVIHSLGSVWLAALGAVPGVLGPHAARPRSSFWLGVVGGVIGVAILLWPSDARVHADVPGLAALLGSTLIFAVASLVQRRWQQQGPEALFAQLSVQMLGGSSAAWVIAELTGGLTHASVTLTTGLALTWLVLVASIIGFGAFATVLRDWPPSRAGSYAVVNPIVSVLLGVVFAGETVSPRMVAGALVTLVSVAWVQWCHRPSHGLAPARR